MFSHSVMQMIKDVSYHTEGYLCTGESIVVDTEPCFVCGMALVHARIKRVFICSSVSDDSPYIRHMLHRHKELNHRFAVYRVCT